MAPDLLNLPKIRAAIKTGRYDLRQHARQRAREREITIQMIEQTILRGEIVERQPRAKPYPKCLMMRLFKSSEPLYVSLAYNATRNFVYIITVHWFDSKKWLSPWTRR